MANFATTAHFSDLKQELKNVTEEVRSKYQDTYEKLVSLSNKSDSHKSFAQNLSQDLTNLLNKHEKISGSIVNLSGDITTGKEYVESSLSSLQEKLLNYINDSIAAIPKPVIPSLDDARKALDEKLIPASLDAKNANLRSSNNEQKIYILEKKIEQLQLLLNKFQIQG
jgi:chromosome segregation ATPase